MLLQLLVEGDLAVGVGLTTGAAASEWTGVVNYVAVVRCGVCGRECLWVLVWGEGPAQNHMVRAAQEVRWVGILLAISWLVGLARCQHTQQA